MQAELSDNIKDGAHWKDMMFNDDDEDEAGLDDITLRMFYDWPIKFLVSGNPSI